MSRRLGFCLIVTSILSMAVRAEPLKFSQIAANASGYIHFDCDCVWLADFFRQMPQSEDMRGELKEIFGGTISGITGYVLPGKGDDLVAIIQFHKSKDETQANASVEQMAIKAAAAEDNSVIFMYQGQKIYSLPAGVFGLGQPEAKSATSSTRPTDASTHGNVSFGLAFENVNMPNPYQGPHFLAFPTSDSVVGATSLPAIAHALDVLGGKKLSLAQQDSKQLKMELPSGAFVVGAGMTMEVQTNGKQHHNIGSDQQAGMNIDLFGSLKGKAQLARFAMGENSQNIYVTTSLGMVGGDAANQVVNLLTGFKAMLTLTRPDQADLIAPLTAQCKDKEVTLQWTWPSSKLPELIDRLDLKDQSDEDESPTTRPVATQPAH